MVRNTAAHRALDAPPVSKVCLMNCTACGGPARPDDVEVVVCPWCARRLPMASDVRERIRAARQLRISEGIAPALIARCLDQPTASQVNLMGLFSASVMLLAWPACMGLGVTFFLHDNLNLITIVALLLLAPALIWMARTWVGVLRTRMKYRSANTVPLPRPR